MLSEFPILNGSYLRDLLAQPQALAATVEAMRELPPLPPKVRDYSRIVLTGMGSSLFALHPLHIQLIKAGRTAMMVETAELVHSQATLLDGNTLVVAVSQSGRSVETVALLDMIRRQSTRPFVLGVTNTADSPLATGADSTVMLRAGAEFSVSCKTYLATLVALEWVGCCLCGGDMAATIDELDQASAAVESYLSTSHSCVRSLVDEFRDLRHLFLTGRGRSLAAVGTGALILKESTRFHAEGMSSPAFRHGPLEMVNPRLLAIIFAGDACTLALNASLVRDIQSAGGRAVLVGDQSPQGVFRLPLVPARLRPVVEMLPVQMLSLALAVLAGREPGVFERATKVTATP